jgi:serine/threonine protein kinase
MTLPSRDLESLIAGERVTMERAIEIVIASSRAVRAETRSVVPSCILISEADVTIGELDVTRVDFGYIAPEFGDGFSPEAQTRDVHRDGNRIQISSTFAPQPEHAVDRPRAVVFSLGCVLWELLAGRRLFRGASDYESMMLVRAAHVPTIDVDPDLESIVRKALAKNVEHRYETPAQLADALAIYVSNRAEN